MQGPLTSRDCVRRREIEHAGEVLVDPQHIEGFRVDPDPAAGASGNGILTQSSFQTSSGVSFDTLRKLMVVAARLSRRAGPPGVNS